ncbi:Sqstm1, partial [Symbiodinium microadriaticum]
MATGWSVAEGVALSGLRQVIVPQRCETLLLIRIRSSADILLNFPPGSRDAFLEELWQAMVRAGWPGLHVTESDSPDEPPKDFVVVDPDAVLPLLDLSGQRQEAAVGTLAFVEPNVFALLPRASASLLLSGAETARFGFMDLQRRVQPKAAGAGVCWQWQRHFFVLKAGRLNDRCIGWCRHPNSEKWSGQVLLQNITQ